MQQRTFRALAASLALVVSVLLAPAPAQARTACDWEHYTKAMTHKTSHYHATFWFKWCVTPRRRGPDKITVRPMSANVNYHTSSYIWHPSLYCFPYGDLDFYVFRFRVWNPVTGYNKSRELKVDCTGDGNSDVRSLTSMPACKAPSILVSQGRGGEIRHRRWCHLSIHVERVYKGPDPNGQDWIMKRHKLVP